MTDEATPTHTEAALMQAIEILRARAEAAEKDAARYRWLSDSPDAPAIYSTMIFNYSSDDLDAAIDAAIAAR